LTRAGKNDKFDWLGSRKARKMLEKRELPGDPRWWKSGSLKGILIGICITMHLAGGAQQRVLNFTNISTEQGLSENTVLDIVQDPYGYMWFATENGLTKFDGANYTVYRHDVLDSTSLASDEIQSLCIHGDELFIAGVYPTIISAFNLKTEKFRTLFSYDEIDDLEKARFLQNDNYTLLLTYWEKFIYNHETGQFEIFNELNEAIGAITKDPLNPADSSMYIPIEAEHYFLDENDHLVGFDPEIGLLEINLPDFSHKILFGCRDIRELYDFNIKEDPDEVFVYRDSEKRIWFNINQNPLGFFHQISGKFHSRFQNVFIKDILEDADHNLWFASESGILFYDADHDLVHQFTHDPTKKYSLSNNYAASVFMNDHEILWVGHDGGGVDHARYYNIKSFQHLGVHTENALVSDRITGISESKKSEIWISTDQGVSRWDRDNQKITSYLEGVFINSIFCDSKGNVWCVTEASEILRKSATSNTFEIIDFKKNTYETGDLFDIPILLFEDSKDRLWLIGNGLFQIDYKAMELINNDAGADILLASSVSEDARGNFWITGNTGRLIVIHPDSGTSHFYCSHINDPYSLNSNILWDSYIDKEENLWIATNKGVNKTNIGSYSIGDALSFESYTLEDGLNDEIVFRILEDQQENFWFATNNGLSKLDKQDQRFINYFTLDGIASNSIGSSTNNLITYLCAARLSSGEILLGSDNGITSFHPEKIMGNRHRPPVIFTDLKIYNRSVPIGNYADRSILSQSITVTEEIELSYQDKVFSLDFIALDYTDARKNQYEYMLEGFDDDWIFLDNNRVVTFTNIPGGEYILKIRAANNEGFWNEQEASLGIRIRHPFWQAWWFRMLGAAFIVGAFFVFYSIRVFQIQHQKSKLETQVKERTQEIEWKNQQLEEQTARLNEANTELEENKRTLEDQSEELQVINARLVKQNSELEELNRKVSIANQTKLKFFTNISHELRTPLSLIMGPIDNILSNVKLSGYAKDQLGMMNRNSRMLLKLINQLLDFRKLETEHMKLAVAEGNIILFLKEIHMLFSNVANQKHIDFEFFSPVNELRIWYDADKIEKIISNLLSNAFKYTPEGGKIGLGVNIIEDPLSTRTQLQILVSDTGIGIARDKVEQIFERYYSVFDSGGLDATSAGIGLALTKELVELHKGKISVSSKVASREDPESGTHFTISLPIGKEYFSESERLSVDAFPDGHTSQSRDMLLDIGSPETDAGLSEPLPSENKNLPEVLVVEDNTDMRDFIKGILVGNYKIHKAENGKQGLEILEKNNISLIISDVMMPVMEGIEFCRSVKENLNSSHIPVILLTAKTDIESQIHGLKTGADDYITKPFNSQILTEKIGNLIQLRERIWDRFNKQLVFNPVELTSNSLDIKLLNRVKEVTEKHLSNPDLDVALFAREVGMSKSILYEKLKSLTGKTINDFISSMRLKRAAEFIMMGEMNLSEISLEVGYQDPNYFSKSFKKHFGVVPSKFTGQSIPVS
jgi:signal transduction histidine kinase/DNA-binding response OmpR family regulator/ligand-binding sensor domain-containing protein